MHNSTSIYWEKEPEATPIAYVWLIDRNRNMTYNSTGGDTLYHAYYHTNRAEYAASLGAAGANFTTFFNATKDGSTFCNDTQYWYVHAASNSSCTIHNYNWTNTSKTGQYQEWFINWSVNSSVPVNAQGLVVCSPSGFCHTYDTPGLTQIEENYDKVIIIIPENVYSIIPSFFEELFLDVVIKLGKEKFLEKFEFRSLGEYKYEKPLNEAIERILRKNTAIG